MQIPKITLKEYITSYNYRKQLESHSRSKQKNIPQKKTYLQIEGGPTVKNEAIIQKKVEQIKLYSRAVIHNDSQFAKLEKMLSELLRIFIREIQTERNSHNVINSMIRMSTARMSPKSSRMRIQYDQHGNIYQPQESKIDNRLGASVNKTNINQMSNVTNINQMSNVTNIHNQHRSLRPVTNERSIKSTSNNNLLQVNSVNPSKNDMSAIQIDLLNMKLSACKQQENLQQSNIRESNININIQDSNLAEVEFDILGQSTLGKKRVLFNQFDSINQNQKGSFLTPNLLRRNQPIINTDKQGKKEGIVRGRRIYENKMRSGIQNYKIQIKGTIN